MKNHAVLAITMILTLGLNGCGGGSSGSANNNTPQYGQLSSVTQFNFNNPVEQQPATLLSVLNQAVNFNDNLNSNNTLFSDLFGFTTSKVNSYAENSNIDHINAYAITYNTPGVNPQTDISRQVSGLVLVPVQADGALINNIKGVMVFYHQTEVAKNSVPSCLTSAFVTNTPAYCHNPQPGDQVRGDDYFQQLSAVYAAAGYIVLAPDYIGEGVDYNTLHPYAVIPQSDSDAGLYMIGAARTLLAQKNLLATSVPLSLFITGYSEGGSYALNASQEAQTDLSGYLSSQNVTLKITAPAEGPYDVYQQMQFNFADLEDGYTYCGLSGTTPETCNSPSDNTWYIGSSELATTSKPLLVALPLTTIIYYGLGNNNLAYQSLISPDFFNVPLNPGSPNSPTATLAQIFTSPVYKNAIALPITINAYSQINQNGIAYGVGGVGNNSISAFVNSNVINSNAIVNFLKAADTYHWTTKNPINFIHLNYDSVVTIKNYTNAYGYMSQIAPALVEQTSIPNASIADSDECLDNNNPSPEIFCQGGHPDEPIDHGNGTGPLMYIGALCAFEHIQGLSNICSL